MIKPIKTILFATTLDKESRPVTRMAASLAMQYEAKVILLHAVEPISAYAHALVESYLPPEKVKEMRAQGEKQLLEIIQQKVRNFFEEEVITDPSKLNLLQDVIVKEEAPANLILDTAEKEGVDLIVMGTQHGKKISKLLIGSTARKVVEASEVPVLVVPL